MAAGDPAARQFLRHTLATLAYRGGKAIRGAPPEFAEFRAAPGTRTPVEILAHIGDLLEWMTHLIDGRHIWNDRSPGTWNEEIERFHRLLGQVDALLAHGEEIGSAAERLFQGPVADALTHTGQIAMLRRMAGAPIRGENYFRAGITAGRTAPDQEEPRREFD